MASLLYESHWLYNILNKTVDIININYIIQMFGSSIVIEAQEQRTNKYM